MRIEIRNCGCLPAKKNRKRIAGNRLVTDPEVQHQIEAITQCIALELYSEYQRQIPEKMRTTCTLPQWIASSLPLNDSIAWVQEEYTGVRFVEEGQQGAVITINKLEK
jgi:hypothetical protein